MNSRIVERTINTLNALTSIGIKFRIELPDGKSYGNLAAAVEKSKKRKLSEKREFGAITNYFKPLIQDLQPGELTTILVPPIKDLNAEALRSAISAWCATNWGKKSVTTAITKTTVEVLRIK